MANTWPQCCAFPSLRQNRLSEILPGHWALDLGSLCLQNIAFFSWCNLFVVVVYLFIFKPVINLVGLKLKTLLLKGSGGGVGWGGRAQVQSQESSYTFNCSFWNCSSLSGSRIIWVLAELELQVGAPLSGSPFSGFLLHFPVTAGNPDPVLWVFSSEGMWHSCQSSPCLSGRCLQHVLD